MAARKVVEVGHRKDGSLIWLCNSVSLALVTESIPRFIVALSEDIVERKKAEEALRKSEERVRLILDSAAEGIFGCGPEGTCLFCNPAAVRLLGYDDPSVAREKHARWNITSGGREAISWPPCSRLGVADGTKVPLKILDLHPNTLRHRMSKLGIQRSSHRQS
jgi:PAS domain-containing protein